jgi:hypothetical protein
LFRRDARGTQKKRAPHGFGDQFGQRSATRALFRLKDSRG